METTDAQKFVFFLGNINWLEGRPERDTSWPPEVTEKQLSDYHRQGGLFSLSVDAHRTTDELIADIRRCGSGEETAKQFQIVSNEFILLGTHFGLVTFQDGSAAVGYYTGHSEISWYFFENPEKARVFIDNENKEWS